MALTGDLSTFNFVDIFQVIARDRKSGILMVEWKDMTVAYYVKDGELVFARPVDKVYRVYAERHFDSLLTKLRISKDKLYKTIEKFFLPRIDNREGIFSFTLGFIKYDSDVPVYIHIEELIMRASRTLTPEEVERKISDEMLTFEVSPDVEEKLSRVKLSQEEEKVLSLVDGERTVGEIKRLAGFDDLTVGRALYGLLAAGFIKRKKREVKPKLSITLDLLTKIIEKIKVL